MAYLDHSNRLFAIEQASQNPANGQHRGLPCWLQRGLALMGLLMLGPLFLVAAILIKLESKGNVLHTQVRVGKFGRNFNMYKFRSMYLKSDPRFCEPDPAQSDREGVCKKYVQDPRITRIGKFIRKYSIDELPQLLNVLKGDMMLIGPRPALVTEVNQYDGAALKRLDTEAGLTGLWQISGRADTTFEQQVQLDNQYISQQSIYKDVVILLSTVPCVLSAKGAY